AIASSPRRAQAPAARAHAAPAIGVTRGIGWLETALGVTTTLLLMSAAVYGARAPLPTEVVAALMSLLAGFTVAFRSSPCGAGAGSTGCSAAGNSPRGRRRSSSGRRARRVLGYHPATARGS